MLVGPMCITDVTYNTWWPNGISFILRQAEGTRNYIALAFAVATIIIAAFSTAFLYTKLKKKKLL